ncbi:MAG: TIGR03086 family metal-binding protein [Marmoricola sp.]
MSTASPPRSVAVLDSAVTWTRSCLQLARTFPLTQPTPCAEWDLGQLLVHMDDSLVAMAEAAELGYVRLDPQPLTGDPGQLVDLIVQRACRTRAAWQERLTSAPMGVGDLALGRDTIALVGALEIAVHGWDVARATGQDVRLPEDLAVRLYDVALVVVPPDERGRRFGPVVPVPSSAPMSIRLLAHLGRSET